MARGANSFARGGPRFKAQPTVLVICEDSKSAVRYLDDAKVHFRSHAIVEVTHIGRTDPKGIVQAAIERSNQFNTVYCAIDRDAHESFDEALRLANTRTNVKVIASYPCFEYWYLLHFGFTRKSYAGAGNASAGDRLIADLRGKPGMQGYAKGDEKSVFGQLLPHLATARQHSRNTLVAANNEGELNPSTQVHELMDVFEQLSTPQPR